MGGYLAGFFFVVAGTFGEELAVDHDTYCEELAGGIHLFIYGLEGKYFISALRPAEELVFVIGIGTLHSSEVYVGADELVEDEGACFDKALIEVNSAYKGFEGIAEYVAATESTVVLVVLHQLVEAHAEGDIVHCLATHDAGTQLGEVSFGLVGVFFEEVFGNDGAEYGIAQEFKSLVAVGDIIGPGAVHECELVVFDVPWPES